MKKIPDIIEAEVVNEWEIIPFIKMEIVSIKGWAKKARGRYPKWFAFLVGSVLFAVVCILFAIVCDTIMACRKGQYDGAVKHFSLAPQQPMILRAEEEDSKPFAPLVKQYTFSWDKPKDIAGKNPKQRSLPPIEAVVTRNDSETLEFSTPGETYFKLHKEAKSGKFVGEWHNAAGDSGSIWLEPLEEGGFTGEESNDFSQFIPCGLEEVMVDAAEE